MIIVFGSLTLAAIFFVIWLVNHDLRRQIEQPKHDFQNQLRQYDEQCRDEPNGTEDIPK